MRLLLDHGLPRRAAADLRALGWDVVHSAEFTPAMATDADVVAAAQREARAVVTLDHDFSRLLAVTGASGPSVICCRAQDLNRARTVELMTSLRPIVESHLARGVIVSVDPRGVRIRALPLRSETAGS